MYYRESHGLLSKPSRAHQCWSDRWLLAGRKTHRAGWFHRVGLYRDCRACIPVDLAGNFGTRWCRCYHRSARSACVENEESNKVGAGGRMRNGESMEFGIIRWSDWKWGFEGESSESWDRTGRGQVIEKERAQEHGNAVVTVESLNTCAGAISRNELRIVVGGEAAMGGCAEKCGMGNKYTRR